MNKEIARISDKCDLEITAKKHAGDDFIKLVTLGFAGNDSYSVQVSGRTFASENSKKEAIQ
jgi:hypothetical protein